MAKRYTVYLKMHVRDMKKESQQIKKLKKQLSEIQTLAKIGIKKQIRSNGQI